MPKPNLVLVVLDDLIEADLTPDRAPNWTDLSETHGTRHANAYSMPVCSQSRACLVFGKYGRTLGITEAMSAEDGPEPPAGTSTLPGLLKTAGYSTALVGKWHLGRHATALVPHGAPLSRGYDRWLAGTLDNLNSYTGWQRWEDGQSPVNEPGYATSVQMAAARAWWDATKYPKFLHIALAAPHAPFHNPPAALLDGYTPDPSLPVKRQQYERMIRSADWALGELRKFPGIQNTIVCVVSDNGTPVQVPAAEQNPDRVKTTTYEDGIHVAMAWYGPGIAAGGHIENVCHLVDVPARFLNAAGVEVPPDWDGQPFVQDYVISEATLADGTLERAAISSLRVKLRRTANAPEELYDLTEDPLEEANLIESPAYADARDELREVLYGQG